MRYHQTTEATECIDLSQATHLFQCNWLKHKQIQPPLRATIVNKVVFFGNICTCLDNYNWQFLIFTVVQLVVQVHV